MISRFVCLLLGHDWHGGGWINHRSDSRIPPGAIAEIWICCYCGARRQKYISDETIRARFAGDLDAQPVAPSRRGL